jgi:hypothetical protein
MPMISVKVPIYCYNPVRKEACPFLSTIRQRKGWYYKKVKMCLAFNDTVANAVNFPWEKVTLPCNACKGSREL